LYYKTANKYLGELKNNNNEEISKINYGYSKYYVKRKSDRHLFIRNFYNMFVPAPLKPVLKNIYHKIFKKHSDEII